MASFVFRGKVFGPVGARPGQVVDVIGLEQNLVPCESASSRAPFPAMTEGITLSDSHFFTSGGEECLTTR